MPVRAGLGLAEFPFSDAAAFWKWIDLCDAGGVDSLWQSDRLTGPQPFLEAMSVMAALAGRTRRMKFGMNVLSIGFREPLVIAKACATIDFLSNGRMLPAFGIGNLNSPDWTATGLPKEGQGGRTDEALDIIAALWRGETVDTDGKWFRYKAASIAPLPVQKPLPLWIGGSSPAAIRRTGRIGTGWSAGLESPAQVAPVVAAIKAAAIACGREMDPEHFGAGFFYRFGPGDDPQVAARRAGLQKAYPTRDLSDIIVTGGAAEILQRVADYHAAGITKFILRPLGRGDEDIYDQTRRLIETVLPNLPQPKLPA